MGISRGFPSLVSSFDLNKYRECNTEQNRLNMCASRSAFKHVIKFKKFEARKQNTHKFITARFSNAKLYWKLLKESTVKITVAKVGADTFTYFKATVKLAYSELGFSEFSVSTKSFQIPGQGLLCFNQKCSDITNSVSANTRLVRSEFLVPMKRFK